jgi:hypothetical protein
MDVSPQSFEAELHDDVIRSLKESRRFERMCHRVSLRTLRAGAVAGESVAAMNSCESRGSGDQPG